jgi:hypothetical protein
MTRAVSDWLFLSAIGILFGFVWSWFWVNGRIAEQPEWWQQKCPHWMQLIAGRPRASYGFSRRVFSIFPKVVTVVGLIATLVLYQLFVRSQMSIGLLNIWQAETSFPLLTLLTWGILVWLGERALKRLKSRRK